MTTSPLNPQFIIGLKERILRSRYQAAKLVNTEMLALYYNVGKVLSQQVEAQGWGAKVLDKLSAHLQTELPGLRGFSAESLRKMRLFYEAWQPTEFIAQKLDDEIDDKTPTLSVNSEKDIS